jgi:hypothetical protein
VASPTCRRTGNGVSKAERSTVAAFTAGAAVVTSCCAAAVMGPAIIAAARSATEGDMRRRESKEWIMVALRSVAMGKEVRRSRRRWPSQER